MECADCGDEYGRYRIEFSGRVHLKNVTLNIGGAHGEIRSENTDLCSKCMLKAIGSGIVHGGSISTSTVWAAETDGGD